VSLQATPAVLNFDPTGVENTSPVATVTITNSGTLSGLTGLSLTASTGFALVGNTCTATLAAQAQCTVGVEFAPSAPGPVTGSISAASDAAKFPMLVALSGTGVDFTVSPLGAISQTVSAGQAANFNLTIAPLGGVQAVYALQCGTLPAHTLCTCNPASEAISGTATGTAAVQLSTGQSNASELNRERRPHTSGGLTFLTMVCGGLLLPWAVRRARRTVLFTALLAIVLGGVASCVSSGGGTGGVAGAIPTPPGTYSIPVTVTSNGISHSITLTLIVD